MIGEFFGKAMGDSVRSANRGLASFSESMNRVVEADRQIRAASNEEARIAKEKAEHEKLEQESIKNGNFPGRYGESLNDSLIREIDLSEAIGTYALLNQKIQKKSLEVALYAVHYDKSVRAAMSAIEAEKGYMPIEVLQSIPMVIRNKMIEIVNPSQIVESQIGMVDPSMGNKKGSEIHGVMFSPATRGTKYDFSGEDLDSTHYIKDNSEGLIRALDHCVNEMHKVSEHQRERAEAGESLDNENDFTYMFDLDSEDWSKL